MVAEDFEVLCGRGGRGGLDEVGDGVGAEVGGDVADAEAAVGVAGVAMGLDGGGQGRGVLAIPGEVFVEDGRGVGGGMVEEGVDEVAVRAVEGGVKGDGLAVGGDGFIETAHARRRRQGWRGRGLLRGLIARCAAIGEGPRMADRRLDDRRQRRSTPDQVRVDVREELH